MNLLNTIDIIIIIIYFLIILGIGIYTRKYARTQEGFFLGRRRFGKLLSIFLAFGSGTNSDSAIATSRETFRQGLSGIWVNFLYLYLTPIYWFFAKWFRRLRVLTPGDIIVERYESKSLAAAYSLVSTLWFASVIAIMFTGIGKTVESLTPKPPEHYTIEEQKIIEEFQELKQLHEKQLNSSLNAEEQNRLNLLQRKEKAGVIRPSIPIIDSRSIVPFLALTVIFYAVLGGLSAAAMTDTLQGILILILSFILLPSGLIKVGGFSGLHAKIPDHVFHVFGSIAKSEYTIPYIISIVLLNLSGYLAQPQNIATAGGAAKDEITARIGFVTGSFMKRFCTVLWAVTGIIGFALFAHEVTDPDLIWGHMTLQLLGPGFIGAMLVCLIAAMMSTCDAYMISGGALITKNIYTPLNPDKSDKHYLVTGKILSAAIVVIGMVLSIKFNDVLSIMKQIWSLSIIFGPAFWLAIIWRRATSKAVWVGVVFSFFVSFLGPTFMSSFDFIAKNPRLLVQTSPVTIQLESEQINDNTDTIQSNKPIQKTFTIPSVPVYFDKIVHENPDDMNSSVKGEGRFRIQILIMNITGLNVSNLTKSQLNTIAFLFDVITSFLILIIASLLTKPNQKKSLDMFYAKFHTPVNNDPEKDAAEVEKSLKNPNRWDHQKLFPNTSIEILKPTRVDLIGFFISCLIVVGIVGILFGLAHTQWP